VGGSGDDYEVLHNDGSAEDGEEIIC